MRCHKYDDYLRGIMNLSELKDHVQSCEDCNKEYHLDSQIMERSKKLNQNLTVPDLWPSIKKEIEMEEIPHPGFRFRKKLILAAAAMIMITAAIWVVNLLHRDVGDERILSSKALEKVKEAEKVYIDAIRDLEDSAYLRLETTSEPLAQLYRNKLSLIDQQIRNCQEALENNSANSHIRRYLLAALQDKQKTLKDILQTNS